MNSPRMFKPSSRFEDLAGRPGGISRDEALHGAGKKLVEIDGAIQAELRRAAGSMRALLARGISVEQVAPALELCGVLHDLGKVAGYDAMTALAGRLAATLEQMKGREEFRADVLDCFAMSLELAGSDRFRHAGIERVDDLMAALDGLVRKVHQLTAGIAVAP